MARWRVTVDVTITAWGHVIVDAETEEEAMAKARNASDLRDDPITLSMEDFEPTEAELMD